MKSFNKSPNQKNSNNSIVRLSLQKKINSPEQRKEEEKEKNTVVNSQEFDISLKVMPVSGSKKELRYNNSAMNVADMEIDTTQYGAMGHLLQHTAMNMNITEQDATAYGGMGDVLKHMDSGTD